MGRGLFSIGVLLRTTDRPASEWLYSLKAGPAYPNVSTVRVLGVEGMTVVPTLHGTRFVVGVSVAIMADTGRAKGAMTVVIPLAGTKSLPNERSIAPVLCLPKHTLRHG